MDPAPAVTFLSQASKELVIVAFLVAVTILAIAIELLVLRPRRRETAAVCAEELKVDREQRQADRVVREQEIAAAIRSAEAHQASAAATKAAAESCSQAIAHAAAIVENARAVVDAAGRMTDRLITGFEKVEAVAEAQHARERERDDARDKRERRNG